MFPVLVRRSILSTSAEPTAATLYGRAGLGPGGIDVAQVYDCFTITVLMQLEAYGFCPPGEGGPFVDSGALEMTGSLPINTAGGNLSEEYIHGMNHILEGARQVAARPRRRSREPRHASSPRPRPSPARP